MKTFPMLLALIVLTAGCSSTAQRKLVPTVQRVPSDLRMGSYPEKVIRKMGHPTEVKVRPDGREIWVYRDLWWNDSSWGSWELFFTSKEKLSGWRLIDPPSNQDFNREAFFNVSNL